MCIRDSGLAGYHGKPTSAPISAAHPGRLRPGNGEATRLAPSRHPAVSSTGARLVAAAIQLLAAVQNQTRLPALAGQVGTGDRRLLRDRCGHRANPRPARIKGCLLYTSDAADDLLCVDLGGRRIIK